MRRTAFTLVAMGAILLLAGPATAQYPEAAAIAVSDTTLSCPGQDFTISGEGFVPGDPVTVSIDGEHVATVQADENGEFSLTIEAPDTAAGQHTITAESSSGETATATVTCVGAAVAFTGADISNGLILLTALVAIGAVALYTGRRRARAAG